MSAGIIKDIVEGSARRDSSGWHATRVYHVELPASSDPTSRPYLAAVTQGVPAYGEAHPAIPSINVSSISVEHHDADPLQYLVSLEYGGDESGVVEGLENTGIKGIEVSTSTVTYETLRDFEGNLMTYRYEGPEFLLQFNSQSPPVTSRFVQSVNAEAAQVDIPTSIVTVTRSRKRPSHVESHKVAGLVNDSAWSGLSAKKWLCLGIDSSLDDSGKYDWRYIFAIAPKVPGNPTWQFRSEIIRNSNWVRRDASIGNGVAFFDVYKPDNFNSVFGFQIPA